MLAKLKSQMSGGDALPARALNDPNSDSEEDEDIGEPQDRPTGAKHDIGCYNDLESNHQEAAEYVYVYVMGILSRPGAPKEYATVRTHHGCKR